MKIIFTWLLFIGVIAVNALANILPINGMNTGQISSFYPNTFVPAGFTFSIWGVIYLLLFSYTIGFTFYTIKKTQYEKAHSFIQNINSQFWITCILNMAWIIAWHYLQIELSVAIMLFFLGTLIHLFLKSQSKLHQLSAGQKWILYVPFMVYLGWISVATIANITALLVAYKWAAFGILPIYWSAVMISIAIILAWYMVYQFKNIPFALVVTWALWGIYNSQGPSSILLTRLAAAGIGFLCTSALFTFIQMRRKNKMA
jgi:hypothetical protein